MDFDQLASEEPPLIWIFAVCKRRKLFNMTKGKIVCEHTACFKIGVLQVQDFGIFELSSMHVRNQFSHVMAYFMSVHFFDVIKHHFLTLSLLWATFVICKLLGPRSGSKPFDSLIVFLKDFFENLKIIFKKVSMRQPKHEKLPSADNLCKQLRPRSGTTECRS